MKDSWYKKNLSKLRASSNYSQDKLFAEVPPERIILCRLGGIGDVMHTLPLVRFLKSKYKNSSIEYLTSPDIAELLKSSCPAINKVWIYNKRNKSKVADEIKNASGEIDYFFNLHSSLSFFFFNMFYVRARKYFHYKKDNNFHAVVNFAKTYNHAISALDLEHKTLFINDFNEVLTKYGLKENKYICIVPGVGKARMHRAWPIENWVELVNKYLKIQNDFNVVCLGGEDETTLSGYLSEKEGKVINLIGKLNLIDSARIISASAQIVSGDTGLLHIAGALSKNVLGLYGPTSQKRSGPYTGTYQVFAGENCRCSAGLKDSKKCSLTKAHSGECMKTISVNDVLSGLIPSLIST